MGMTLFPARKAFEVIRTISNSGTGDLYLDTNQIVHRIITAAYQGQVLLRIALRDVDVTFGEKNEKRPSERARKAMRGLEDLGYVVEFQAAKQGCYLVVSWA